MRYCTALASDQAAFIPVSTPSMAGTGRAVTFKLSGCKSVHILCQNIMTTTSSTLYKSREENIRRYLLSVQATSIPLLDASSTGDADPDLQSCKGMARAHRVSRTFEMDSWALLVKVVSLLFYWKPQCSLRYSYNDKELQRGLMEVVLNQLWSKSYSGLFVFVIKIGA